LLYSSNVADSCRQHHGSAYQHAAPQRQHPGRLVYGADEGCIEGHEQDPAEHHHRALSVSII
jgi:hypothetical protein